MMNPRATKPKPIEVEVDLKPSPWNNDTIKVLFSGVTALAVAVLSIILPWLAHQASVKADEVAIKLDAVTTSTKKKLDDIADVGEETRTWVNHLRGVLLKDLAETKRRIADMTKSEADATAATLAENLYTEHKKAQESVDALQKDGTKKE